VAGFLICGEEMMQIFIPSLGRADQAHHTIDHLPPAARARTKMVIGAKDFKPYAARFGKEALYVVDVKGIGKVRQHIIDISEGPVLMLDDDLSFFVRRKDNPQLLQRADATDVTLMLKAMESILKTYAHASIAVREGANRNPDDYFIRNTRCLRALGYNADILKREGVRFDRLPVMEDFDVALQLLRLGYESVTLNRWCQDQGRSNAPGGCSTYRSMEVQSKGARGLAKLHPKFVTVVKKQAKSGDAWAEREDVRISWKKAYQSGRF
jgi:hypothetical protein